MSRVVRSRTNELTMPTKRSLLMTVTKILTTITVASVAFSCSSEQAESKIATSGSGGKSSGGSGGSGGGTLVGGSSSGGSATGGSATGGFGGATGGSPGTGGAGGTSTGGSSGTAGSGGGSVDGGQPIGAVCVNNTNCSQSQGTTVCCAVTGCSTPCECQLQTNCPAGVPYLPCNTGSDCAQFGGGKVCCEEKSGSTTQRFCTKQSGCSGTIIP